MTLRFLEQLRDFLCEMEADGYYDRMRRALRDAEYYGFDPSTAPVSHREQALHFRLHIDREIERRRACEPS